MRETSALTVRYRWPAHAVSIDGLTMAVNDAEIGLDDLTVTVEDSTLAVHDVSIGQA